MALTNLTADVLLKRARFMLRDITKDAYDWTNTELLYWLDDAQAQLLKLRPDLYLSDSGEQDSGTAITAPNTLDGTDDKINVNPQSARIMVDYVVAMALRKRGRGNELATLLEKSFYDKLGAV